MTIGTFVTFEGPDGSGKTTQIQSTVATLRQRRHQVLTTREPGGTEIGNAIRNILLDHKHVAMSSRGEALLFSAARAQLVDEVVRPALARGEIVLCDRYADSTLAYQGYGRSQDLGELRALTRFATGGLVPDLTIYLDLEPAIGLERKQADCDDDWNRLDAEALSFHQTVRAGYLQLATEEPKRWLVVDAAQSIDRVQQAILERLNVMLPVPIAQLG